jgi:hypothetical protein
VSSYELGEGVQVGEAKGDFKSPVKQQALLSLGARSEERTDGRGIVIYWTA